MELTCENNMMCKEEFKVICLSCRKEFPPLRHNKPRKRRHKFCRSCSIDWGNQLHLDATGGTKINELKDRATLPPNRKIIDIGEVQSD